MCLKNSIKPNLNRFRTFYNRTSWQLHFFFARLSVALVLLYSLAIKEPPTSQPWNKIQRETSKMIVRRSFSHKKVLRSLQSKRQKWEFCCERWSQAANLFVKDGKQTNKQTNKQTEKQTNRETWISCLWRDRGK